MALATLSAKGQIVLPRAIREALKLRKGDRLEVRLEGDRLVLTPVHPESIGEWHQWRGCLSGTRALQDHMDEHAEEVRRERLS